MKYVCAVCLVTIALAGCRSASPTEPPIALGPTEVRGFLRDAPLSLGHRGTHILAVGGRDFLFVESPQINLRPYEGRDVVLKGIVERNTDPKALPVLRITDILETALAQRVRLPSLQLSLDLPGHWFLQQSESNLLARGNGTGEILFAVQRSTGGVLPPGSTLFVDGRRATRTQTDSEDHVTIEGIGSLIHITRYAYGEESRDAVRVEFLRILRSMEFTTEEHPSSVSASGSVRAGSACGGEAGVLCPTGQQCIITDPTRNIGRCRSILDR